MDKDILKYLAKNNYLKEKLEVIDNLIKKQEYKEAYFKLAAILQDAELPVQDSPESRSDTQLH